MMSKIAKNESRTCDRHFSRAHFVVVTTHLWHSAEDATRKISSKHWSLLSTKCLKMKWSSPRNTGMYDFVVQKRIVLEIHQKLIFVSKMVCLKHPIFSIYGASHAAKRYVTLVRQGERVRGNISETGMQIVERRVRDKSTEYIYSLVCCPSCKESAYATKWREITVEGVGRWHKVSNSDSNCSCCVHRE